MRYFDIALWDGVQEDAVLAGTFAKISQNPAMKQHVLGTGTKRLAEASPFDPAWGTGLREDDPEASNPPPVARKKIAPKSLFCRPRCHPHKRGLLGKHRLHSLIPHSDLARRNS